MFGHFLGLKFVFNGLLCHFILLREVEKDREDTMSYKLLGRKVSFEWEEFNIMMGLLYNYRREVQFKQDKALRLRRLYLADRVDMNGIELDKLFSKYEFKSYDDVVKAVVFYLIELALIGKEQRQHMDQTMLSVINDWEEFANYD